MKSQADEEVKKKRKSKVVKLAPEIYYDYIYDIRLDWVKYGIPISFIDPKTKFRVEGLIYSPKKRNRESTTKVSVYYNFEGIALQQPVEVACEDILPSRRILTKMNCESTTVIDKSLYKDPPAEPMDFLTIKKIFDVYKGISWTLPELCTILNRPLEDIKALAILPFLGKRSIRSCRITNEVLDTYEINTPESMTPKVTSFSIDSIAKEYDNCDKCSLSDIRKSMGCKVVMGRGNKADPKIFILGEAPGTVERDTGIVFNPSAAAGNILFRVMTAADISQETDCYMTNTVLCWPSPGDKDYGKNGKPTDEQIGLCSSRLKTELAILKPKVIVLLGVIPYKALDRKSVV